MGRADGRMTLSGGALGRPNLTHGGDPRPALQRTHPHDGGSQAHRNTNRRPLGCRCACVLLMQAEPSATARS